VTNPLVEREWLTGDELTAAGSRALADLTIKVRAQRRRITAGISTEEYLATVDVLRRMARNLV
jgi:DNA-binding MarR family transcriptional regulator